MGVVIILATVMAIFGVISYQRGTKSSVFLTIMVLLELLLMDHLGNKLIKLVNGINYGLHFTLSGGLQALGGSGDKAEAIKRVTQSMGKVQPLIKESEAGIGLALIFSILVIIVILLGGIKWFKSQPSGLGLMLGLVSGYLVSAHLLGILLPEAGLQLPLPSWLGGNATRASTVALVSESNLIDQLTHLVTQTLNERTLAWIVVIIIVLFVFLATRFSNQGTKKG